MVRPNTCAVASPSLPKLSPEVPDNSRRGAFAAGCARIARSEPGVQLESARMWTLPVFLGRVPIPMNDHVATYTGRMRPEQRSTTGAASPLPVGLPDSFQPEVAGRTAPLQQERSFLLKGDRFAVSHAAAAMASGQRLAQPAAARSDESSRHSLGIVLDRVADSIPR